MDNDETSICPLCRHESMKIFAFGECLHSVCYVCSTKMRVLCEQSYCAICRQDLNRVYFVPNINEVRLPIEPSNFKPIDGSGECGIYYAKKAEWIRIETENLLRNFCPLCRAEFESFEILREHVRRNHRLFYCDLCVEHLNLFPYERKYYNRSDLVQHIRSGDRDDKSFKGHPLCKFCDDHFLDNDHLYKHMRQEHYYCHLCSSDNIYYSTFDLLRVHYRNEHYLCEIGQCREVQFTNVFANEFEFRAHQSSQHGTTRAKARQLGTIPVEFQLSAGPERRRQHQQQQQQQPRDASNRDVHSASSSVLENEDQTTRKNRDDTQQNNASTIVPTIDDFPALSGQASSSQNLTQQRGAWSIDNARGLYSTEDFPTLPSSNSSNNNVSQLRGNRRENQIQSTASASSRMIHVSSSSSLSSSAAAVAATGIAQKRNTSAQSLTNGLPSMNAEEEFPELKSASGARIVTPVSSFSAWSTTKKYAKQINSTNSNAYRPQTRMSTKKIMSGDDEDNDYIRRPMSSLMTSTAPNISSNITIISSSDSNGTQTNDKTNKDKNQSVPKLQDFPELPTTTLTNRVQKILHHRLELGHQVLVM